MVSSTPQGSPAYSKRLGSGLHWFTPSLYLLNRERRGRPWAGPRKGPFRKESLLYRGQVVLTRALAQEFPASQLCATLKFLVTSHDLGPHQGLKISGPEGQGLPKMTQQIRLLLGLGQACPLAVRVRCILGMDGLPHVRHCFYPKPWLLGP